MRKLLVFAFFLCAVGAYAQDHNSVRGRLNLIGISGIEGFDLNLIRTGPDANKVIFEGVRVSIFIDNPKGGSSSGYTRVEYLPYNSKGPIASFLIDNLPDYLQKNLLLATRVDFRVRIKLEQKNIQMENWPEEIWHISFDLETGVTSYRGEGILE